MSSLDMTREADLAARWDLSLDQFRVLRRRHGWSHVKLSRQDIRYTEAQVEHIIAQMTVDGRPAKATEDSGQTARSARRAS